MSKGTWGGARPGGGRPKGSRNKSTIEIMELAKQHGPKALKRLSELLDSDDEEIRHKAANSLLDRGFGRPAQQLQHAGHDGGPLDVTTMSLEDLEAMSQRIIATLSQQDKKDAK